MQLDGRRGSSNIEDHRSGSQGSGKKGSNAAKGGLLGTLAVVIGYVVYLTTGDSSVLQSSQNMMNAQAPVAVEQTQAGQLTQHNIKFTEKDVENLNEESLAQFCSVILASTEDVWTYIFKQNGLEYRQPKMVLFEREVRTACGAATSATGPFYCSGDQKLYIDLSFYTTMKNQLKAGGDFAYAYVIAHEVGHHVEYELGLLNKLHRQMDQCRTEAEANKISVRIELLADFYAGVWGYYENKGNNSISDKDVEEAIKCARQIGDDYLQKSARGYVNTKEFTHGTSEQRMKWFKLGLTTGDLSKGQVILTCPENEL